MNSYWIFIQNVWNWWPLKVLPRKFLIVRLLIKFIWRKYVLNSRCIPAILSSTFEIFIRWWVTQEPYSLPSSHLKYWNAWITWANTYYWYVICSCQCCSGAAVIFSITPHKLCYDYTRFFAFHMWAQTKFKGFQFISIIWIMRYARLFAGFNLFSAHNFVNSVCSSLRFFRRAQWIVFCRLLDLFEVFSLQAWYMEYFYKF